MSFYLKQSDASKKKYAELLKGAACLSKLSSDSDKPYINYRIAENIFCKSFSADNVSRKDCSVDAVKFREGIGIKTFISGSANTKSEKIAEFNNPSKYPFTYKNKDKLVREVAEYRNQRLTDTIKDYDLLQCHYHYVVRDRGKLLICERPMIKVDMDKICNVRITKDNAVKFTDEVNSYSFNIRKNTLFKNFDIGSPLSEIAVDIGIIDEKAILNLVHILDAKHEEDVPLEKYEFVVLPLYSTRVDGEVPLRSGLNQWNASGRSRDPDEIYIPVPIAVHQKKPNFFPHRDTTFKLTTTDGNEFTAKLCQENSKGLMSSPNKVLGKWLLRDTLKIPYGQIVTYEDLIKNNTDTVIIHKLADDHFQITLHALGAYRKSIE